MLNIDQKCIFVFDLCTVIDLCVFNVEHFLTG